MFWVFVIVAQSVLYLNRNGLRWAFDKLLQAGPAELAVPRLHS
jgi:hypothetical protein